MTLYDTHFHLDDTDDANAIISRARNNGVSLMNLISTDLENTKRNISLAEQYDIFTTAGVHPLYISSFEGDYQPFIELSNHPKVVGIGEIGLDFYYHKEIEHQKKQIEIFTNFLKISKETHKPAIIHCRDAFDECLQFINEILAGKIPFIIHCYTGDFSFAKKFVDSGGYISFSGIVTFNNASTLRESLKAVPLDRILLETDSPYLAPVPHRGKRNEPAFITHVLERVAFELAKPKEDIATISRENGKRIFKISEN